MQDTTDDVGIGGTPSEGATGSRASEALGSTDATTVVLGDRHYEFRVAPTSDPGTALLTVTVDERRESSLAVAAWRGISVGAAGKAAYLWSAREVVLLPRSHESALQVIEVDEDLLTVLLIEGGWLLVCETSIRRLVGGVQTARVELDDVVEGVERVGSTLHIRDAGGRQISLEIGGNGAGRGALTRPGLC